jgi:predicted CXXCH cytochrome family protein
MSTTLRLATFLGFGFLLLTLGCDGPVAEERAASPQVPIPPAEAGRPDVATVVDASGQEAGGYVGAAACAACHPDQMGAWKQSDHDLAMQVADPKTVLGDFGDVRFSDAGTTTLFRRSGDEFFIRTRGGDGRERDFAVPYVFGVHPLQQYLVDIGDGHLQAYPIAWDVEAGRWISLYPGEAIGTDDPLHWTRHGLNWNQGCADCHSTDLQRNYDPASHRYETTWSEINVACEACHGPGAEHVARAESGEADPSQAAASIESLSAGPFAGRNRDRQRRQIETCAPCHARRSPVHPGGLPGTPLTDSFRPALLSPDLYHSDGQILDEVYVYGSFVQSRMYGEGVTCTDCHDPHSLELVADGNAVCTQCHEAAAFDVEAHTHHPAESEAGRCVSCHMAETTYMQVDPRRDHGFHIPRPDLSLELGIPNACTGCHRDRTDAWARERVIEWYGPVRPEDVHETHAIAAGRSGAPEATALLSAVVANPARAPIVRATALSMIPPGVGEEARLAIRAALVDPDPLVRSVAIDRAAATVRRPEDLEPIVAALEDPSRLVRVEAAVALSPFAGQRFASPGDPGKEAFDAALAEYVVGQTWVADQPSAQLNLGVLAQNLGDAAASRAAYEQAGRIEPTFVPARFNLAMLDATSGRAADAEEGFRSVLRLVPDLPEAQYSLGLLLGEDPARIQESASFLEAAARSDPRNPRYQYNAGLAAQHLGQVQKAEGFLMTAVNLAPDDADFRNALAIFYVQNGRWDDAQNQIDALRSLVGNVPAVGGLSEAVRRGRGSR